MYEKSDFIAYPFSLCALKMHFSIILVANEDYTVYLRFLCALAFHRILLGIMDLILRNAVISALFLAFFAVKSNKTAYLLLSS